jgi:transcriptional regulator with XRE-family HTH domain
MRAVLYLSRLPDANCGVMKFSEKLAHHMKAKRYTQEKLAAALDVSQNLVSLWARGKSLPDVSQAGKIAAVLGLDLGYLADDAIDEPSQVDLSIEETALLRMARAAGARKLFAPDGHLDDGFDHERWLARKSSELMDLMVAIYQERAAEGRVYRSARTAPIDTPEGG